VTGLFSCRAFAGFGPQGFAPVRRTPPLCQVRGRRPAQLRAGVRAECPQRPGVYGMLGEQGELIYVGKAKSLRGRLLSYFRRRSRDPKAGRVLEQTRSLVWEFAASEFAALLRELELIQRWQPRLNVQGQPYRRRRTYVCVGRAPAPYLFVNRQPPADALACFGPVPSGPRLREAVRRLNDAFRLRDCPKAVPMAFADQGELFPLARTPACLRHDLGTCAGPCAGACTRKAYAEQVRAARAFLAGTDSSLLRDLGRSMTRAAAELAYEKAGAFRDKLEVLRWLHQQLDRLRLAQERHSFVYPVPDQKGMRTWYLIHRGQVRLVVREPRSPDDWSNLANHLEMHYESEPPGGPLGMAEVDMVLLVAAWFRRHPQELDRTVIPAAAREQCRRELSRQAG
jgi:excinuclease ABC subunit C